eukprot:jgi/Phyca11/107672/e_gw1.14.434.1
MEVDFAAAAHATQELMGLREVFGELGIPVSESLVVHMDNQAAIKQVQNETSAGKAKHIDVKYKFTKDLYFKGIITPTYVPTGEIAANLLTKSFAAPRLREPYALYGLEMRVSSNRRRRHATVMEEVLGVHVHVQARSRRRVRCEGLQAGHPWQLGTRRR